MKLLIAVLSLVGTAHAAGSGAHHGSVADLILPASNFVILAGALIFIMRKPLGEMFSKNAKDVEYLLEHAEKKDKEAKIKLNALQEKMKNLDGEKNKIVTNAEKEAEEFIVKSKKESAEYIDRLSKDSQDKLVHEKESRVAQLEEKLVDEVITKAKSKISSDSGLGEKVTKKLISQIR